jgi:hypothetical protein
MEMVRRVNRHNNIPSLDDVGILINHPRRNHGRRAQGSHALVRTEPDRV